MATTTAGYIMGGLYSGYRHLLGYNVYPGISVQIRNYAARKGTRERAKKAKVKKEVKKVGFLERLARAASNVETKKLDVKLIKQDDSTKSLPMFDVWIGMFHQWKVYSFKEAIQCHRETHDPVMYNQPNSFISALIEFDLTAEKKNKTITKFFKTSHLPYKFEDGKVKTVLAFCKTAEQHKAALESGANLVLEKQDIKKIKEGEISIREFNYIVAHPDILPDLLPIKGLLKKKFPATKIGTLGLDMGQLVKKFSESIEYTVEPHNLLPDYGKATIPFGTLDMDVEHLEENLSVILKDLYSAKPKREGPFITRVRLVSPPSPELLKIHFEHYLPAGSKKVKIEEEEEDASAAIIAPV